jgi:hypothetical protein
LSTHPGGVAASITAAARLKRELIYEKSCEREMFWFCCSKKFSHNVKKWSLSGYKVEIFL